MRHTNTARLLDAHHVNWAVSPAGRILARDVVVDRDGNDASAWVDVDNAGPFGRTLKMDLDR